ncbi:MAG: methyl-accepting chemotaxis protein [Lachnospiraceae bacterium]|nr:methyl-accepting chemotaxis protein [Lachnospiraceae bacterium]
MKNMKLYTKLILGFGLIDVFLIIALIVGYETAEKTAVAKNPEQYLQQHIYVTIAMGVIAVAISLAIALNITKTFRQSIKTLSDGAAKLVEGDIKGLKLKKYGQDEFGELIDEYQKVANQLVVQAEVANAVGDNDLTQEVIPHSPKDFMGHALKKLADSKVTSVVKVGQATTQISTSASEVASASEALAQGSTEQASAIEEITASIADIADKTKQNASEADQASELVQLAIVDVKKGNTQMEEMMKAMSEINQSSESISKIIKVIDDIAFQTNILALNAAVEAARAGEAGKGFAVVAEEVRNLAAKSAAAAAETAEMIEDSIQKVEVGSSIAEETEKALEEITDAVEKCKVMITDIAESSNYQATAIEQVDQAITQVSQVVQNNSATSEECAAASVELAGQADALKEVLAKYKLPPGSGVGADTSLSYQSSSAQNEQIISLGDGFGKY